MLAITDAYTPCYTSMPDAAATVYAGAFMSDELRETEAFCRGPAGQKLLQNSHALTEQVAQVGRDGGPKAADDLRVRLTEALQRVTSSERGEGVPDTPTDRSKKARFSLPLP